MSHSITRRRFVQRSAGLASALATMPACAPADERPNIILLMGDDHGWEETGYNGHAHLRTPVLDAMAATGLRLDRFYAAHPPQTAERHHSSTRHERGIGRRLARDRAQSSRTLPRIRGTTMGACNEQKSWSL